MKITAERFLKNVNHKIGYYRIRIPEIQEALKYQDKSGEWRQYARSTVYRKLDGTYPLNLDDIIGFYQLIKKFDKDFKFTELFV